MNETRNTYQKSGEGTLETLLALRAVQLLLAGMYFLFGIKLTKAEKTYRREQAIIMRKSISAANLVIDTHRENKEVLSRFTNDYGPSWRARMGALSLSRVPGICKANIRDLPERMCEIARGSRLKAGNTIIAMAFALVWDDNISCRAPP